MENLNLNNYEFNQINKILNTVTEHFYKSNLCDKILYSQRLSFQLPTRLIEFIKKFQFSIDKKTRLTLISNLVVDPNLKTPKFIKKAEDFSREDLLICSIAFILGEVFGWEEEQNGRIVHDVIPLKSHHDSQESTGSSKEIYWHTEEAFHDYSADYLVLLCIKNPDLIATSYCSINSLDLSDPVYDILFEPKFIFKKVSSHKSNSRETYIKPVLYGCRAKPFIKIDPFFMEEAVDEEANNAFKSLIDYINLSLKYIILKPGDLLILDNLMCVHGRNSFLAKYDGNDRWLKRVNVTRDIYKLKKYGSHILSRILK